LSICQPASSKAPKYESRFAAARKVLKKQLKVNTKVVFDDDGMVCLLLVDLFVKLFVNYVVLRNLRSNVLGQATIM